MLKALVLAAILGGLPAPATTSVAASARPVPILMYHVIAPPLPGSPFPGLYVTPAEFAAQMAWLKAHGYEAVTLDRVWDAWHGRAALPSKPIVLSFDDGYRSHVTSALPVLRRLHWPGVLNLEVRNTTQVWGTRPGAVRTLIRAGWEIDAHTLTHPDLTQVPPSEAWRQIAGSRHALQKAFHAEVEFFCYPSGRFNPQVEALVRRAGYEAATTTIEGLAAPGGDAYALRRVRVDGGLSARGLGATLRALGS